MKRIKTRKLTITRETIKDLSVVTGGFVRWRGQQQQPQQNAAMPDTVKDCSIGTCLEDKDTNCH